MLADDVIEACGSQADHVFRGAVTAFADDVRKAARFDLTQGVILSAQTVHQNALGARTSALPLCRLPFRITWFEWPIQLPSRDTPYNGNAPVSRRCGALVTVDDSRQRGTMSWAWSRSGARPNVHLCPLSVTFDWRDEFEQVEDLVEVVYRRLGLSKAHAQDSGLRDLQKRTPSLQRISLPELHEDRDRLGIVWSPYMRSYSEAYERLRGPIDPRHVLWQSALEDITGEPGMLQSVVLLMNSRNLTSVENVTISRRLNLQRTRKGRQPLLDYTKIQIKLSRALYCRAGSSGEHSPSRMHIVRGHFKVRKSGIYWWSDHARGDPLQGSVRQQSRKVVV